MDYNTLYNLIDQYKIIGITGYPGAGKTTLSARNRLKTKKIIHTDDFLDLPHAEIPTALLEEFKKLSSYIVEGTQVVRLFKHGWTPDLIILVTGSQRTDCKGIKTMIDNRMQTYKGKVITINPREMTP